MELVDILRELRNEKRAYSARGDSSHDYQEPIWKGPVARAKKLVGEGLGEEL